MSNINEKIADFMQQVDDNIGDYLLFDGEDFESLHGGVLGSTEVDQQGEYFSLENLEEMAKGVQAQTIWYGYQHDPLYHMVGRVLAVTLTEEEGHHYLLGVLGFYDQEKYPSFSDIGDGDSSDGDSSDGDSSDGDSSDGDSSDGDSSDGVEGGNSANSVEPTVEIIYNHHQIDDTVIEEIMLDAPAFVSRTPKVRFDKAADPIVVLTIVVLLSSPFPKKLGELAAEDFYSWMKEKISKLASLCDRIVVERDMNGCKVRFVNGARSPVDIYHATLALRRAFSDAQEFLDRPKSQNEGWELLVYEWLEKEKIWLQSHGTSKVHGVVSDRRRMAVLHAGGGLSVSGLGKLHAAPKSESVADQQSGKAKDSPDNQA